jgi:hypothetical protein
MSRKKENTKIITRFPKWVLISLFVLFLLILFYISPVGKTFSSRIINNKKLELSPTPIRIQITIHPLTQGLTKDEYESLAKEDLSKSIGVDISKIEVKTVRSMSWNDASLGCPSVGSVYAQVITPGFLIVLLGNGKEYSYHAGLKRVVLCSDN